MAVTIIKRPFELVPAYNDIEFLASSDKTAQPNFTYYVVISVGTGDTFIERVPADPNGQCYLNIVGLTRKFVNNYYPFASLIWSDITNGIQDFTVNIGEEYGSTPTIHSGSNINFKVWNASLTKKERSVYRLEDYACTVSGGVNFLNSTTNLKVNRWQDLFFYFIQYDFFLYHVTVNTYNDSGLINTVSILNLVSTVPAYLGFNLSPQGMDAAIAADPTLVDIPTTLPVFTGGETYYTLTFSTLAEDIVSDVIRVDIDDDCEGRILTEHNLYYLNRFGGFDFMKFKGNHQDTFNIDKTFYQGLLQRFEASHTVVSGLVPTNGPNPLSINDKALSISYDETLKLISQPLPQYQLNAAKDLFTSPNVFLNIAFQDFVLYSCKDTSYQLKQDLIEKTVSVEATLNSGVTDRRQFE